MVKVNRPHPRDDGHLIPKAASGPRKSASPPPQPTTPLVNLFDFGRHATIVGAIVVVLSITTALSRSWGALMFLISIVSLLGVYLLAQWLKTRATLQATADELRVRKVRTTHVLRGPDIAKVKYLFNGRSPDVMLVTTAGKKIAVPTSLLDKGHSVLFDWLTREAPQAELDKRCEMLRDSLVNEGLIRGPGDYR
ncbi:MAG TPA: hypothetical protein VLR88_02490 [Propionibacteriaceae bacterium]|nr:hypothetical protein [Propionibacteriaceae bacterium]